MPVGDGLAVLVAQGVEHGVVRVNGRQSVLFQLITDNVDQRLHAGVVVCPVANDLDAGKKRQSKELECTYLSVVTEKLMV